MCKKDQPKLLLLTILLLLNAPFELAASPETRLLSGLLNSKDYNVRYASFKEIVANKALYKDAVYTEIQKYLGNISGTPDELIYLAAYLKDQRYIDHLSNLLIDSDYSSNQCIYSCPIVFSLVIFGSFTEYSVPENNNSNLTSVRDLQSGLKRVQAITLTREKASDYITGPGIESTLRYIESLPQEKIIQIASPQTKNNLEREAAAYALNYSIIESKYLDDLYWLAMTALKDASTEYLTAIYGAIYRAEAAKKIYQ